MIDVLMRGCAWLIALLAWLALLGSVWMLWQATDAAHARDGVRFRQDLLLAGCGVVIAMVGFAAEESVRG